MPVPIRVKHSTLAPLGLTAPGGPKVSNQAFTVSAPTVPSILGYTGSIRWLVLTARLPWVEGAPTDLLATESPAYRVDGAPCKTILTASSKSQVYMSFTDLSRATLSPMATRVLEFEPTSRILVRLLPRFAMGTARLFQDAGTLQLWTPI